VPHEYILRIRLRVPVQLDPEDRIAGGQVRGRIVGRGELGIVDRRNVVLSRAAGQARVLEFVGRVLLRSDRSATGGPSIDVAPWSDAPEPSRQPASAANATLPAAPIMRRLDRALRRPSRIGVESIVFR